MVGSGAKGRLQSGTPWLDEVLDGGFLPRRSYLVRGGPGTGKTTLCLHFLREGLRRGERVLFISLGEPADQVRANAADMKFDLTDLPILDLSPSPDFFAEVRSYEIFSPAEVEREPLTKRIIAAVEQYRPERVVVDPISQLRYLSQNSFQFRRQVLSFLHYLHDQGATVLFTSESSESDPDDYIQIVGDGVITLENKLATRTLTVTKFRGSAFAPGKHSMRLTERGIEVYPRLVPEEYERSFAHEALPFGISELDTMLEGGIERGTVTILTGPSGVGKTSLGMQFMREAASRGERSVVYSFEEEIDVIMARCEGLNIPAHQMVKEGTLFIKKIEPLRYSADEFARMVRDEVEEKGTRVVMIDSIAGFRLSLQGDFEDLVTRLHAQCKYLQNMGVVCLLINEVEAVSGEFRVTDMRFSYLADNVLFARYMEHHTPEGVRLAKAFGILKKRLSNFDTSVRELKFSNQGLSLSPPLRDVTSILSSFPVWRPATEGQVR
ncbi:MAG TPA: ATPase domain-containing protein [Oscillatoriaceae cyanobacterium]